MSGGPIGLAVGFAFGLAGFLAMRMLASRVEKPETAKVLKVAAWVDLALLTAVGYLAGTMLWS